MNMLILTENVVCMMVKCILLLQQIVLFNTTQFCRFSTEFAQDEPAILLNTAEYYFLIAQYILALPVPRKQFVKMSTDKVFKCNV